MRFGSVGGVHEAGQGGPYLEVRQPQPGDSFGRRAIGRIVEEAGKMQMGIAASFFDYGEDCLLIHAKLVSAGQTQQDTQRISLCLGSAGFQQVQLA